jgi:hypothetical protein
MINKCIAIYVFIDDLFKVLGHQEDSRRKVTDAEVLTTAIIASLYFGGHLDKARIFIKDTNLVPNMLDKSRFNRRLHNIGEDISLIFLRIGQVIKEIACCKEFILDSFPIPVCDNIRISRSKLIKGEEWRGWKASMRRYFYGIKVHVIATHRGIPVEFCIVPGQEGEVTGLHKLPLALDVDSQVYADAGYTDYHLEDNLLDVGIHLQVQRKANSKRLNNLCLEYIKQSMRKRIETTFSEIKGLFASKIHAVTLSGFLIKVFLFLLAFQLNKAYFN